MTVLYDVTAAGQTVEGVRVLQEVLLPGCSFPTFTIICKATPLSPSQNSLLHSAHHTSSAPTAAGAAAADLSPAGNNGGALVCGKIG